MSGNVRGVLHTVHGLEAQRLPLEHALVLAQGSFDEVFCAQISVIRVCTGPGRRANEPHVGHLSPL